MNTVINSSALGPQATVIPETNINVEDKKSNFTVLDPGADLEELVKALGLLGTTPREMAQILQGIKAAGALHAEIIVS